MNIIHCLHSSDRRMRVFRRPGERFAQWGIAPPIQKGEKRDKQIPGDQKGLFKLSVQLRKFFNSVIYNTATGYVLLVYLTNI
jgi:hypothetical protein